jgi:hypothetical protein
LGADPDHQPIQGHSQQAAKDESWIEAPPFRINQEYERGVLFRLGRLGVTKGPGLYWLIPLVEPGGQGRHTDGDGPAGHPGNPHPGWGAVLVNAVIWFCPANPVLVVTAVQAWQRAIAREAGAIREKRARIIKAEGQSEAANKLAEAATIIGRSPGALELRRLQTLTEIGVEHNSTIIAMLPVELLHAAQKLAGGPEKTAD